VELKVNIFFNQCFKQCLRVHEKMKNRVYTAVKLSEEERKVVEVIAKSYDISISDVIRIALMEYAQKHRNDLEKMKEGSS